jgi:hypothetical protein
MRTCSIERQQRRMVMRSHQIRQLLGGNSSLSERPWPVSAR